MENNKNLNEQNTESSIFEAPVYDSEKAYMAASADEAESERSRKRMARAVRRRTNFGNGRLYRFMIEKGALLFLLSFFIPAAIMTFAFAQHGIHPFGKRQILVVDLWHQYYPFFRVEREKLLTGGSFFYSWQNGMGSNFLSLISYYAMSPLNWISIFFSEQGARDALTLTLIMKIGFSGAFFSCFLRYTYKRRDFSIVFFSVMYALCSYTLGYYWNTMWFDTVALFPLVMLGIVAICREGKWKTFTFALALSLITNYYIGFFTCIFSIFMFAAAGIIEFKGIKDWLYKFYIMVRSSILGIALGAFILLPAYFGLAMSYSNDDKSILQKLKYAFSLDTKYYEKWTDIFANTISYNEPVKVEGLPNIACGMLAIVLFGVFLFSLGIKVREKVASLTMLYIIIISCNLNKLNYIWHGFHFTNQIPYRFAFIFSFVLVASAFRAYDIILKRGVKIYQLILMTVAPAGVFYLNYLKNGNKLILEGAVKSSLIITAAYLLIFLAAKIFPFRKAGVRNAFMSLALAAAVFSEFISTAKIGVKTVGTTGYFDYPAKYDEISSLVNTARKSDDTPFYRTEVTKNYTINDSALYGYDGISQFSSSANVSVTRLSRRFGIYASESGNRYYYRKQTPLYNSLFCVKYLINKDKELIYDDYALEYSGKAGNCYMYENKYPLSLGFMMNEKILELPDEEGENPFEYQNDVIKLATGIEASVFTARTPSSVRYINMNASRYGFGNYSYTNDQEDITGKALYKFKGVDNTDLYAYASCSGSCVKSTYVKCNDLIIDEGDMIDKYPLLFPIGCTSKEDIGEVEIDTDPAKKSGNYKIMVYGMSHSLWDMAYERLADEQLEISSFEDTKITGKITAKKAGVMFLSIPYEKGWRVYVDGKEQETVSVLNAMLGVKLSEGEHNIRIEYVPEGFASGIVISTVSAALIVFLIWFEEKRRKKRLAAENAANVQPVASDEPDLDIIHKAQMYDQAAEEKKAPEEASEQPQQPETEAKNEKSQSDDSLQGD